MENEDSRLNTMNKNVIENINNNNEKYIKMSEFLNKNCKITIQHIY